MMNTQNAVSWTDYASGISSLPGQRIKCVSVKEEFLDKEWESDDYGRYRFFFLCSPGQPSATLHHSRICTADDALFYLAYAIMAVNYLKGLKHDRSGVWSISDGSTPMR